MGTPSSCSRTCTKGLPPRHSPLSCRCVPSAATPILPLVNAPPYRAYGHGHARTRPPSPPRTQRQRPQQLPEPSVRVLLLERVHVLERNQNAHWHGDVCCYSNERLTWSSQRL